MRKLFAILSLLLPTIASAAPEWELASDDDGVQVYSRAIEGSDVKEMKAYGTIDAPPERVLALLADVEVYEETMPYTEESKLLKRDGNDIYFYTRLDTPLVAKRDYALKITISKQADGSLKSQWWPANHLAPKAIEGVVRVGVNEGYWLLTPAEGGAKTKAVYFVKTDPGGAIPSWIVNKANTVAVPDVFLSLRKGVKLPRFANAKSPIVEAAAPAPAAPAAPAAPVAPAAK